MKLDSKIWCWEIRRNGTVCAHAQSHQAAQSIIRQLRKIRPQAEFKAIFIGTPITHCDHGGKAID